MNNKFYHPYHLVTKSPWPLLTSIMIMNLLLMMINWFNMMNYYFFSILPCLILCIYQWWRDVVREATYQGCHTSYVYLSLRMGMILFITSEVFFFLSFFWAYFHSSLSPSIEIGQMWPPLGILPFNPFNIPLMNSIILISSGLSITWSHHSILMKNFPESIKSMIITILLGIYFTILQIYEYSESNFTITDSIYGSTFFISTGFHGLHVIIGTIFLMICLYRMNKLHFSPSHHFGFEAATWYWHFVDVVWLFLYLSIYWWTF